MSQIGGPFLYPNVTSLPGTQPGADRGAGKADEKSGEFGQIFDRAIQNSDLNPSVREPLKFSAHAQSRLMERKIKLDPGEMEKIRNAVDRAESKGVEDTLVLTPDAALIVNVPNRTVVTAMDRQSLTGNVFTNIDGAVIV